MKTVEIENVTIHLSHPDELPLQWVGQQELLDQILAAWLVLDDDDFPLNPRLIGKPGVGKTTLAYAAGKRLGREVYLFQATMDTRPEDLLITPVLAGDGKIQYMASGIVTAMITGGVAVLDEGNRMSEKSWASLAPLLDNRRYVESIVAGVKIRAHPDFRICVTMNDDASTFEIPEYIHSRLQPQIFIDFPEAEEERQILLQNLPFAPDEIINYVVNFLQLAHMNNQPYTVRDGINIARYALKLLSSTSKTRWPRGKIPPGPKRIRKALAQAIEMILDESALDFLPDSQ
ncbi:MAG: MoxR family ATPase [Deltaproteobacteria bacterium]|nr:MAG: MoxR family ATPase [Deltaproteobacteria bacterium]